jgi:hypothetical protein
MFGRTKLWSVAGPPCGQHCATTLVRVKKRILSSPYWLRSPKAESFRPSQDGVGHWYIRKSIRTSISVAVEAEPAQLIQVSVSHEIELIAALRSTRQGNAAHLRPGTDGSQTRRWRRKADSNRWSHLRVSTTAAPARCRQPLASELD